ncbi:MAG: hypothetical protein WCO00_04485 [Rhodospirillaceae bacterium]
MADSEKIGVGHFLMEVDMARQEFRDFSGRCVGWIEKFAGRLEARDYAGLLKGWFDVRANETRDYSGRMVGRGNMLAALIFAP